MSFINVNFLVGAIVVTAIFSLLLLTLRKKFTTLVKQIWSFRLSKASLVSTIFYFLALFTFAISMGDLRGPEEIVESNIPNQRTVVLIDNSMSMLVEDIRPNRISKAAIIAKHFVKNAYGHQVALSIFSDIQKKIVPFTDDMDILESRLGTMLSVQPEGGSNVSLALKEAFQYFKTSDGYEKGNILLITDGEEHGGIDIDVPDEISLAIVGVGTADGGKIPVRNKQGNFLRYKKFNGIEIVSKMNKSFFEKLVGSAKYAKAWFVESYSLPTNDILGFFKNVHLNSFSKGNFRARPVYGYWIIIAAVFMHILSVIFGRLRSFRSLVGVLMLVCLFSISGSSYAQDENEVPEMSPYQQSLIDKMRNGEISKQEKLKLAELFLKQKGGEKQASDIYAETLDDYDQEENGDLFNYATSLLKNNRFDDSVNLFRYVKERNKSNNDLKKAIDEQIKLALKKQEQKKQKEKQDKESKKNKDDKKDQKNNESEDQNDQSDNKKKDMNGKGEEDQKNDKKKGQGKDNDKKDNDKKDKGDKNKKDPSTGDKGKDKKKQKTKQQQWQQWQQVEADAKKKKNMRKANGVFKQIMNDDANLQRKFIDTSSEGNSDRKDW